MDDGVIIFIPYGSRLGFHVGGPASTMANIDYKFPQCVCYEVQMDGVECLNPWDPQSKRQYRIDGTYCTLNAGNGAGGQAHGVCYEVQMDEKLIVLNDQGGAVMDVSYDKTATLRAQDHGHPPVTCYAIVKLKDNGNPHSGIHETDVSCTLDLNGANPNCEQGGGY